jgi:hypothetical protein
MYQGRPDVKMSREVRSLQSLNQEELVALVQVELEPARPFSRRVLALALVTLSLSLLVLGLGLA